MTLLAQDDSGGLQVAAPEGWIDAPPVPAPWSATSVDMGFDGAFADDEVRRDLAV